MILDAVSLTRNYRNKQENRTQLQARNQGSRPFEYQPSNIHEGNGDVISQLSEERKLESRSPHSRARMRADTQDYIMPDFGTLNRSVDHRPIVTPPHYSVGIQPSNFDRSAGVQMSHQDKSAGVQFSRYDKSAGIQMSQHDKSAGIQMSQHNRSAGVQMSQHEKSAGVQASQYDRSAGVQVSRSYMSIDYQSDSPFDKSAGMQVGRSLNGPDSDSEVDMKSEGVQFDPTHDQGVQFDEELKNKSIQADEQPLKDIDIQCDMSENDVGIQANINLKSRGVSAGSDSLINVLRARDLQIVDKSTENFSQRLEDNNIDFSCQFSYHTIASTDHDKFPAEPESEEEEESVESSELIIESLSSHVEQLSSSEHEKMTVYRCKIPDFSPVLAQVLMRNKNRPSSLGHNKNLRDIQRRLVVFNRPFMPKHVKHKKNRSENASVLSKGMDEKRYYEELMKRDDDDEDEYPEYILDTNLPAADTNQKLKDKDVNKVKNPNFVTNPSPTLKD